MDSIYEEVFKALVDTCISVHVFDLESNEKTAIKTNKFIEMWSEGYTLLQEGLQNIMKNITTEEYTEAMSAFMDLTTLNERLETSNVISAIFKGKVNGWCRARFIVLDRTPEETVKKVILVVEDINAEKEADSQLRYQSQTDHMTDLPGRNSGEAHVEKALEDNKAGMFCVFDVNNLRKVNEWYGEKVGDELLIELANAMRDSLLDEDIMMRLDGDEFAFYCPGVTDREEASEILDGLISNINDIRIPQIQKKINIQK